jgi:hypothetical protein
VRWHYDAGTLPASDLVLARRLWRGGTTGAGGLAGDYPMLPTGETMDYIIYLSDSDFIVELSITRDDGAVSVTVSSCDVPDPDLTYIYATVRDACCDQLMIWLEMIPWNGPVRCEVSGLLLATIRLETKLDISGGTITSLVRYDKTSNQWVSLPSWCRSYTFIADLVSNLWQVIELDEEHIDGGRTT